MERHKIQKTLDGGTLIKIQKTLGGETLIKIQKSLGGKTLIKIQNKEKFFYKLGFVGYLVGIGPSMCWTWVFHVLGSI